MFVDKLGDQCGSVVVCARMPDEENYNYDDDDDDDDEDEEENDDDGDNLP